MEGEKNYNSISLSIERPTQKQQSDEKQVRLLQQLIISARGGMCVLCTGLDNNSEHLESYMFRIEKEHSKIQPFLTPGRRRKKKKKHADTVA